MQIIIYLALSQSIFSSILILSKKNTSVSDKLLSTWLIFMAIELVTSIFDLYFFNTLLLSSVFLLINPAFYLYIKSITEPDFKLKYAQLLHLIPYLSFKIVTYVIQQPFSINFLYADNPHLWFSLSFSFVNLASWAYYNITSILLVHKHRVNLKNEFSHIEPGTKIAWILFILIFYVVYCFIVLISGILALQINALIAYPNFNNFSVMLILAYVLGFYGLKQQQVYIPHSKNENPDRKIYKYKSSALTENDKRIIRDQIIEYFQKKRPYLNQDFNLTSLSGELNIPKHYLTEVLNTIIGLNFFSFVNKYRVQAVKEMLEDKNMLYSIEAIGYECGFNSKSSFFSVFKSTTGMTPLHYRSTFEKN